MIVLQLLYNSVHYTAVQSFTDTCITVKVGKLLWIVYNVLEHEQFYIYLVDPKRDLSTYIWDQTLTITVFWCHTPNGINWSKTNFPFNVARQYAHVLQNDRQNLCKICFSRSFFAAAATVAITHSPEALEYSKNARMFAKWQWNAPGSLLLSHTHCVQAELRCFLSN